MGPNHRILSMPVQQQMRCLVCFSPLWLAVSTQYSSVFT
uniref:Uncharacterized protein n=1 Tax=Arundo donax TaxID=35708 RepID=A0A0A8XTT1_ARUDO